LIINIILDAVSMISTFENGMGDGSYD